MTALRIACAVTLAAMLFACASAPPVLVALPPAPHGAALDAVDAPAILLRQVSVPGYLDGFPVVTQRSAERIVVDPGTEWAERLSDGAARVLRAALSQRLGPEGVLIEGDGRLPDADLTIEFLALDPRADRLVLDARWSFVAVGARSSHSGRTRLEVPLAGHEPSAVAAATAVALGGLADVLAREAAQLAGTRGGERAARPR